MSDNTTLNPGAGGDVIASDDVGGVKFQRVKLDLGSDGASVPVAGALPVSAAALPLPLGAATEATIAALLSAAQAIQAAAETLAGRTLNTGAIAGTVALDAPSLAALAQDATLAGVIRATDSPYTTGDKGVFVLGKRRDTDTTMVADGDYSGLNLDEVGRLKVATQPGTIAADVGTITAVAGVRVVNVERASNISISMVGASLSGHNATFEYSNNSTNGADGNWYGVQVVRSNANTVETATGVLAATPVYGWEASVNAYKWFRVRATAHTSGTATYTLLPGSYATEPVPAMQVTATQPVSGSVTATLAASVVRGGFMAKAGIWYDDSATVLASNATFTGTARDLTLTATAVAMANAATYVAETRISAESDQAGTLWIEASRDNVNWRRIKSAPTEAVTGGGQFAEIIHRASWRYLRAGFTNGPTLQTRFNLGSVLMAA